MVIAEQTTTTIEANVLSKGQIETFLHDGVLVVENILTTDEVDDAMQAFHNTLASQGVDAAHLAQTGHGLTKLSSTNGSGGVLDVFYDAWKLKIATHRKLFRATQQLWEAGYYCYGENDENDAEASIHPEEDFKWHPYGSFDCRKGYCYIDRVCFRIPTKLAKELGTADHNGEQTTLKSTNKKSPPIQRSLTPHLDCCPDNLFHNKTKWRPIQCFVSLTDNQLPNTGGFEAAKGFHRTFHAWAAHRPPTIVAKKAANGETVVSSIPAPCVGEYTHIRPKEDQDVMKRVAHIPVAAGSAVFWDNRIPHANAYRHDGDTPRCVVYCSFLPDIAINRQYVSQQLEKWRNGLPPTDQWIQPRKSAEQEVSDEFEKQIESFDLLQRRLLGLESW